MHLSLVSYEKYIASRVMSAWRALSVLYEARRDLKGKLWIKLKAYTRNQDFAPPLLSLLPSTYQFTYLDFELEKEKSLALDVIMF